MKFTTFPKTKRYIFVALFIVVLSVVITTHTAWRDAKVRYDSLLSKTIYDRNGIPLSIAENSKGHYVYEITELPEDFIDLLLKKEDRFFRYHIGVNPVSSIRAAIHLFTDGQSGGSSTLTQQLAKNLLGTEVKRNFRNKLLESFYAVSIELFTTKADVLVMYANSVYLGNQVQGFNTASYAYFDKPLTETTHSEKISLLATLSYPSSRNPWEPDNAEYAHAINVRISPHEIFIEPETTDSYSFQRDAIFELSTAGVHCDTSCTTTIDDTVTQAIRTILNRHINDGWRRNIRNGAVVVIDPVTEDLIAFVGSRNPKNSSNGNQINMAIEPRPIGSTIKPFIYAKGFEAGLRPYSFVEDREYKYPIATGFSLYPKNYDGQYHGKITLHTALSNSLNVPSVKTLEFVGLENFYAFLSDDLKFEPIQDYDSYQYGIALGGLEMDLLTLTHYFTLFPRHGSLAPLQLLSSHRDNFNLPPQSHIEHQAQLVAPEYIELVHAIISDRFTGVNQFGLEGNLNLTQDNYAVKTGTSRDFHDSWVVGYTGDFVVGVWLGNSENEALEQVSGSTGAGAVWHDVMQYLFTTPYNKHAVTALNSVGRVTVDGESEWGLPSDIVSEHQNILLADNLIISPHSGDTFELTDDLVIPLRAQKTVSWSVNGQNYSTKNTASFSPTSSGTYEVSAFDTNGQREIVVISVIERE